MGSIPVPMGMRLVVVAAVRFSRLVVVSPARPHRSRDFEDSSATRLDPVIAVACSDDRIMLWLAPNLRRSRRARHFKSTASVGSFRRFGGSSVGR